MSAVLFQTLLWTGVLIGVVLAARRPVTRHLGPQAAYALWLLPAARLLLPPVTLPAWMAAPETSAAPKLLAVTPPVETAVTHVAGEVAAQAPLTDVAFAVPPEAAPQPGFDFVAMLADWPIAEALLALWLGGAAVFLWRRFGAYFALRAALLAEGREVGRVKGLLGKVRLIETPATTAPLAMGVLDPVIALPPGFLALHDRAARDLALAHEIAHHRGGDLLVNVLVQPLFALHWFNPLARYGWLALRRDQEAACDARVMARRSGAERAAYAALIARFAAAPGAAGSNAALTAPMACPVLGEKSIIHRLRSLSMNEPTPRRRLAGRVLLGAGLLALPLTASVSYAASEAARAAQDAPEPPAPPAPPEPPLAPDAPAAPDAPPAPPAPPTILTIDPDGTVSGDAEVTEHVYRDADGKERRVKMVIRRDGKGAPGEAEAAAGQEEALAAMREAFAEVDRVRADLPRIIAEATAASEAARAAGQPRVIVRQECKPGSEEVSETTTKGDVQIISICQKRVFVSAVSGLKEAREEIARDRDIPESTRKQLLDTLDRQIARWSDKEG
jgi:beta-lactamase regulating signal transducer with metallopeptidase domain